MTCSKNCRILVLDVIGVICLLVLCVMPMTLCCSLHVFLHQEFFLISALHLLTPMVLVSMPTKPNLYVFTNIHSLLLLLIFFRDTLLQYTDEVTHLGHILTSNLNDRSDIIRVVKDLNRKANSLLYVFRAVDPFVKNFLLKSYCLSLYGCGLWSLSSSSIKILEVSLNKLLRKLWCLPRTSHSSIVHCISQIDTISAFIFNRSHSLLSSSLTSSSSLVRSIFSASSQCVYSFIGYNNIYGFKHLIRVSDQFSATITSDSFFLCSGRTRPNSGSGFR